MGGGGGGGRLAATAVHLLAKLASLLALARFVATTAGSWEQLPHHLRYGAEQLAEQLLGTTSLRNRLGHETFTCAMSLHVMDLLSARVATGQQGCSQRPRAQGSCAIRSVDNVLTLAALQGNIRARARGLANTPVRTFAKAAGRRTLSTHVVDLPRISAQIIFEEMSTVAVVERLVLAGRVHLPACAVETKNR